MPKYTKMTRKKYMKKHMKQYRRGRTRRGGYWFYPGPGDDEHVWTKMKNKASSFNWKFWEKKDTDVPTDELPPLPEEPAYVPKTNVPEQKQEQEQPPELNGQASEQPPGSLTYPNDNKNELLGLNEQAPESDEQAPEPNGLAGGRRRRRTTKKRKRTSRRKRTYKRRRSIRRKHR
jgi:hypothetical protein